MTAKVGHQCEQRRVPALGPGEGAMHCACSRCCTNGCDRPVWVIVGWGLYCRECVTGAVDGARRMADAIRHADPARLTLFDRWVLSEQADQWASATKGTANHDVKD